MECLKMCVVVGLALTAAPGRPAAAAPLPTNAYQQHKRSPADPIQDLTSTLTTDFGGFRPSSTLPDFGYGSGFPSNTAGFGFDDATDVFGTSAGLLHLSHPYAATAFGSGFDSIGYPFSDSTLNQLQIKAPLALGSSPSLPVSIKYNPLMASVGIQQTRINELPATEPAKLTAQRTVSLQQPTPNDQRISVESFKATPAPLQQSYSESVSVPQKQTYAIYAPLQQSYPAAISVPLQQSYPATASAPLQQSYPTSVSIPQQQSYVTAVSAPLQQSYPATASAPLQQSYPASAYVPQQQQQQQSYPATKSVSQQQSYSPSESIQQQQSYSSSGSAPLQQSYQTIQTFGSVPLQQSYQTSGSAPLQQSYQTFGSAPLQQSYPAAESIQQQQSYVAAASTQPQQSYQATAGDLRIPAYQPPAVSGSVGPLITPEAGSVPDLILELRPPPYTAPASSVDYRKNVNIPSTPSSAYQPADNNNNNYPGNDSGLTTAPVAGTSGPNQVSNAPNSGLLPGNTNNFGSSNGKPDQPLSNIYYTVPLPVSSGSNSVSSDVSNYFSFPSISYSLTSTVNSEFAGSTNAPPTASAPSIGTDRGVPVAANPAGGPSSSYRDVNSIPSVSYTSSNSVSANSYSDSNSIQSSSYTSSPVASNSYSDYKLNANNFYGDSNSISPNSKRESYTANSSEKFSKLS